MELTEYVALDRDARNDARDAAIRAAAELFVAEVALRLRRIEPSAHQIRIYVQGGLVPFVGLVRVENADGKKVRKPRPGLVEQMEGLLGRAAKICPWPTDTETVVVLPNTAAALASTAS